MTLCFGATTILVTDYDAAIDFFCARIGLDLLEDTDLGGGKRWVRVGAAGGTGSALILARATTPEQRAALGNQCGGRVGFFLHSRDFHADHARMVAAGVAFEEAPRREPYGHVAVFRDLYGNRWDLLEVSVQTV